MIDGFYSDSLSSLARGAKVTMVQLLLGADSCGSDEFVNGSFFSLIKELILRQGGKGFPLISVHYLI